MTNESIVFIIIIFITTILYLKSIIKRICGHIDDDEYLAQKEDVLNSYESYSKYSVTISRETAQDIHFEINLMRPIMLASILLNVLFIPILLFKSYIITFDYDTFLSVFFGILFVIGGLTVVLGYIKEKTSVRFMFKTFLYLLTIGFCVSSLYLISL